MGKLSDLGKLSDVVKNVATKAAYEKLAAKVINVDTNTFVLKTEYRIGKTKLEKKVPDITNFVKETKLAESENKIPDVSGFAIKPALTAVENKISSVSDT